MKLKQTEALVKEILIECKPARDDDDLLYAKVCEKVCPEALYKSFAYVIRNRSEFGLPIYETVRRSRQKLQEMNEELRGSLTAQQRRQANREKFLEYVRS